MACESVVEWLTDLGLGNYSDIFVKNGLTHVHQLQGMTMDQMKALGIDKLGHVKRILKNVPNSDYSGSPEMNHKVNTNSEAAVLTSSVAGRGESPPPPVPERRRRLSSPASSERSSPHLKLSQEEDLPPQVPRRQQSLRDLRRRSRDAESIPQLSASSDNLTVKRRSLPPDSISPIQYLPKDKLIRPPIAAARRLSLSTSPPLIEVSEKSQVESSSLEDVSFHPLHTDPSQPAPVTVAPMESSQEPSSSIDLDGLSISLGSELTASCPPVLNVPPEPSTVPCLPPHQTDTYVNVTFLKKQASPVPLPRRAASMKQPVPLPRKSFGGSFKQPPTSAEPRNEDIPHLVPAPEKVEKECTTTTTATSVTPGESRSSQTNSVTSEDSPSKPVSNEETVNHVPAPNNPGVLYTTVGSKMNSTDQEPNLATTISHDEGTSELTGPVAVILDEPSNEKQPDTTSGVDVQTSRYSGKNTPTLVQPLDEYMPMTNPSGQPPPQSSQPPYELDTPSRPRRVEEYEPMADPTSQPPSQSSQAAYELDTPSRPRRVEQYEPMDNPSSVPSSEPPVYEAIDTTREPSVASATSVQSSHGRNTPPRSEQLRTIMSSPNIMERQVSEPSPPPGIQNEYISLPNGNSPFSRSVSATDWSKHSTQVSRVQDIKTLPVLSNIKAELSPTTRRRLGTLETGDSLMLSPAWAKWNLDNQAPKTKQGWMEKRGGKHGEKPWQQRWFTFDEQSLRYFKTKNDKESEFLKEVKVQEIIDVKQIVDKDNKKPHRLDLITSNRVFQFAAPSEEECLQWIAVLQGAMASFKPSEVLEGGMFHNPDKCGYLLKQGHGTIKRWEKRFVAVKGSKFAYYSSKEDFLAAKPIHVLESKLMNVRPDSAGSYKFIVTTAKKSYHFQASTDMERTEWVDALRISTLKGLDEEKGAPASRLPSSQDILDRIYKNTSNKTCADCASSNPVWASVNLCVMLCINCSGVHRSLGVHISKVRSVELDKSIWTDSLINLMVAIGNSAANRFWEHHLQQEKLDAEVERDIREAFVRAKYETKAWIPRVGDDNETLSKALCVSVMTANVQRSYELICSGAKVRFEHPSPRSPEQNTPLLIAQANNESLQVELLKQNGAEPEVNGQLDNDLRINRQGFLSKTGGDRTGWKKRFCTLNQDGFKYYKDESCSEELGTINTGDMLSVTVIDDDSLTQGSAKYFQFEVTTVSRVYLLGADLEQDRAGWVADFERLIPPDAADCLGYDKVGYLQLNYKLPPVWRQHWFTLKSKELAFYKRGEEKETLDLKKMTDLKGPEKNSPDSLCLLQMIFPSRTYLLRTSTPLEAEVWFEALRHTQVTGIPLKDQQTTSYGVPIIVHKCIQFIEVHGMEVEGIYRHSGQRAKIQKLTLEFNQDAKGVVIDSDVYNVHDVTGCLKQFFRSLPDPLLTHHLYESLIAVSQMTDHESQLYQIQSLIDQLPTVNYTTLKRVIGHLSRITELEEKNKMGLSNIVKIFGPTLMTVDGDTISFQNSCHEFKVITILIKYYKWLFQIDDEEMKKEQAMQDAMKRLAEAKQQQFQERSSFTATFIVTVFVQHKDGDSSNIKVAQTTTVGDITEQVATLKNLPPDNYALYLVMGDAVSERFIHPSERVLSVIQNITSDHYLCIKPNTMDSVLRGHLQPNKEPVSLYVKEKKKWSKKLHAAAVLAKDFVLYKDPRSFKNEVYRSPVDEFDLYIGFAPDVKCPAPTRYQFCLRGRTEDRSKYLCADTEHDLFIIIGAITHAKFPDGISTPEVPRQVSTP